MHGISMGLNGAMNLLLNHPEWACGRPFPHFHNTTAQLHTPCTAPDEICMASLRAVNECTGIPLHAIPKHQGMQSGHPQCSSASFVKQGIYLLAPSWIP